MDTSKLPSRTTAASIVVTLLVLAAGAAAGTAALTTEHAGEAALGAGPSPVPVQQVQVDPGERVRFAPTVFQDVAGQVAREDGEVTVQGRATGVDEVLAVLVDRRGRIASELVTVDDDDVFEEDVALVTPDGTELSEGVIAAAVFSPGRDGVVGDGELAGVTRADLEALDENTRQRASLILQNRTVVRTRAQVLQLFYEESINDTASDDLALLDAFTYTDGRTTILSVAPDSQLNRTGTSPVPVGERMVIRGLTNRKPDDNTITVEALEGPTPEAFDFAATDRWGLNGVWAVQLDTDGVEPGTYVLEADDGDSSDRVEVRVLPNATASVNETAPPSLNATPTLDANATTPDANATTPAANATATPAVNDTVMPAMNATAMPAVNATATPAANATATNDSTSANGST
ncbi:MULTISPECIES: hypothetical protein [Salinibaculum]|uniref:hypothetical protein n=1 Tax=Salinibaculum TaxID=2732368 RepID=UPI0030CC77A3